MANNSNIPKEHLFKSKEQIKAMEDEKLAIEQKAKDSLEFRRLAKMTNANSGDMDSIEHLYRKYVNPMGEASRQGCNTCYNSIVQVWRRLMQWYNLNQF